MNAKKLLALLLAVVMVIGVFAGCDKTETPDPTKGTEGTTAPTVPATYTYNYALSEFPTNWNYHTYQTNIDAEILDYITAGFYTFDYNETMDGYKMVPSMAVGEPKDVTDQYVGKFGIEEGDKAKAYIITLRQDIKWQDGSVITANDFVESAKRLLNPAAQNYRADTMYAGSVSIVGAEDYLKQGQTILVPADSVTEVYSEDLDATLIFSLAPPTDGNGEVSVRPAFGFPASYDAVKCAAYIISNYLADSAFTAEAAAAMEGKTLAEIKADATLKAAWDALIGWWQTNPNEELDFFLTQKTYPEVSWDDVGWFAVSDYELCFVMKQELSGFYLKYNLSAPLVHIPTYDKCESIVDGVYTNTYCTSAENTMSYGPYKLTSFQKDKQYTLEKNEFFYGLSEDTYQTTHIVVDCVPEAATRLGLLNQGKLDTYGLAIDDMDEYQLSDYTYYSTGDSTFAMCFNPDFAALETAQAAAGTGINKTIITIPEFRMAMSFALDRNAFCLATSPLNAPGFGLYSGLIISDPEAGTAYRTTDVAKNVLANFWGVANEYGEGKLYADIDEAIDSITGYNLTKAKEMFNAAYDKAIADGLMTETDKVEIKIGTPNNTAAFYNNGYEFLVNNYTEAVKGTKLEGKLTFSRDDTLGNAYSDALKNNQVDMLFGVGWTGSALDPYGLIEAYVYTDYQYDDCTDFTAITCDIEINGTVYTASVQDWQKIMNGAACTITAADGSTMEYSCGTADKDPETRLAILGALEGAVLQNYNFLPIMDDASAQLRGQQIEYYTEEYIFGMGFGGLKYYTFNYTDAEWDAYVAENNGELDYT